MYIYLHLHNFPFALWTKGPFVSQRLMVVCALVAIESNGVAWEGDDLVGSGIGYRPVVHRFVNWQHSLGCVLSTVWVCHREATNIQYKSKAVQ